MKTWSFFGYGLEDGMFYKNRKFFVPCVMAFGCSFVFPVLADAPPPLAKIVGIVALDSNIEGLTNSCLNPYTLMPGNCVDPASKQIAQSMLFSGDSTTLKSAMGYCWSAAASEMIGSPDPATPDVKFSSPLLSFCGDETKVVKYDLASKRLYTPTNASSNQCLGSVYIKYIYDGITADQEKVIVGKWETLFMSCDIDTYNGHPVYKTWNFTPVSLQLQPTASLVSNLYAKGACLTQQSVEDVNEAGTSILTAAFKPCQFGDPLQYWVYSKKQITNDKGLCVASYPTKLNSLTVDACADDASHTWEIIGKGQAIKNTETQRCLHTSGTASFCGLGEDDAWYFLSGATTQPPLPSNNLIVNNDTYQAVSNVYSYLGIEIPADNGVGANDAPSDKPVDLSFEIVDPIRLISGEGKANLELELLESGGFYLLIQSQEQTLLQRQADKRGTYQFTYRMKLNGQITAPATVTLNVI